MLTSGHCYWYTKTMPRMRKINNLWLFRFAVDIAAIVTAYYTGTDVETTADLPLDAAVPYIERDEVERLVANEQQIAVARHGRPRGILE